MKTKLFAGGTILMLAAASVWAQDAPAADPGLHYDAADYYRPYELSLDGFGTASLGESTLNNISSAGVRHNTRLGGGAGINYFITRYLGLGAELESENADGVFFDSASANLILRLPLGQSGVAPYAFGGGGHRFGENHQWFCQAGAGLEYRFTPHLGLFLDGRAVLPNETKFYGVARLGFRFAF